MSLYLKHRPSSFEEIVGNEETVSALKGMLSSGELPHTLLFEGPTGCGKTTLARIVAAELGCKGMDLREVDSADFRGIDTVREIRKKSRFLPLEGKCRVWIIDECHKMTNDAQNALLKILEDTPSHVYFILCTTDPGKLLPTVKGRCSIFQVRLLTDREMMRLIRKVVKAEKEDLDREVYHSIVEGAAGHPRNALQILHKILQVPKDERVSIAKKAQKEEADSIELCRALMKNKSWGQIAKILKPLQKDYDPESIRRHLLGYAQSVLLNGENDVAAAILEVLQEPTYNTGWPAIVYACYCVVKGDV